MTDTYRHKLNKYSHKVLDRLFFKFSPIMRRSGQWDDSNRILKSELYSNEAFASVSVDEICKELYIPDVLMQDICEYLELHKHIDVTERLNTGIIQKIRATKLGFNAYKFETYLEKNKNLNYQSWFKISVLGNNVLTPLIALVALVYAVAGYYKPPYASVRPHLSSELISPTSNRQTSEYQTNHKNEKNDTNTSYLDTTKQKNQSK